MAGPGRWAAASAAIGVIAACGETAPEAGNAGAQTAPSDVARQLARVEVRPGLWEVASEIVSASQPGMPHMLAERMKGPRGTGRHCITPEQAARPDANFLAGRRSGQCSYRDFTMLGGRIAGTMACRDPAGAETSARMSGTYRAENFDMRMDLETPGLGGATLNVVVRQSGRRIGDCVREGEMKR